MGLMDDVAFVAFSCMFPCFIALGPETHQQSQSILGGVAPPKETRAMAELVGPRLYSCCNCRNHVALHDDVISKAFQGRHGRAFLFSHAMNVGIGAKEDRNLMTGLHTVADVHCSDCREVLGWKYERAYEETQKYKEGKFILEKSKIVKENW
ncbi:unnamed protein product [Linum trigynum]|uniref:Protein yippee-like n=3 Tax=Linum TaxID=4005 RepID=A0AAV2DI95_9ROSI